MKLDVKYINPFITACDTVINQMSGIQLKKKSPYLKENQLTIGNIAVLIGMTQDIRGVIIIAMNTTTALTIAGAMMGGVELTELDRIGKSAISELGNIIMGNVAQSFSKMGVNVNISPPTLLNSEHLDAFTDSKKILCVPLELDQGGLLEINVSINDM